MTILCAWISPAEAVVASDTVGQAHLDGSRRVLSKVKIIPHLNAVLAGRGVNLFFDLLALHGQNASCNSFDELIQEMPDLLSMTEAMTPADVLQGGAGEPGFEVLVAGWSDREARMLGVVFQKRMGMEEAVRTEVNFCVAPWDASMPDIPKKVTRLQDIAREQVKWMRSQFGEAAAGGRLTVCRVTRRSMTVSNSINLDA